MKTTDFIKEGIGEDAHEMHLDHEVQMARSDCYNAAKNAIGLHKLLQSISEQEGLEGWVSEKISLAADYLNTVHDYLQYEAASQQNELIPEFTFEEADSMMASLLEHEQVDEIGQGDYYKKALASRNKAAVGVITGDPSAQHTLNVRNAGLKRVSARNFKQSQEQARQSQEQARLADAENIEDLKANLASKMEKFKSLGGDSYKYADRMMPRDYEAQKIDQEIALLKRRIASAQGMSEDPETNYNVKQMFDKHDSDVEDLGIVGQGGEHWAGIRRSVQRRNEKDQEKKKQQGVSESVTAGGIGAGSFATSISGKGNKPGTGIPKKVGNTLRRVAPKIGKGIY